MQRRRITYIFNVFWFNISRLYAILELPCVTRYRRKIKLSLTNPFWESEIGKLSLYNLPKDAHFKSEGQFASNNDKRGVLDYLATSL